MFTGQKLEDMDISVHCDITVFDWLMRWVKKDLSRPEIAPTLGIILNNSYAKPQEFYNKFLFTHTHTHTHTHLSLIHI